VNLINKRMWFVFISLLFSLLLAIFLSPPTKSDFRALQMDQYPCFSCSHTFQTDNRSIHTLFSPPPNRGPTRTRRDGAPTRHKRLDDLLKRTKKQKNKIKKKNIFVLLAMACSSASVRSLSCVVLSMIGTTRVSK
jgi:hypothetical protein